MAPQRITSLTEFWPYYLREHRKPVTRAWHYLGSTLALLALAALAVTSSPWFLLVGLVAGYGPAWVGHFGFEKNRPATFKYPLWSLACDWRMYFAWASGRLAGELQKAGVTDAKVELPPQPMHWADRRRDPGNRR